MKTNLTQITIGECLSSADETIKRNAMSILKRLQNKQCSEGKHEIYYLECPSYECRGEEAHCKKCDYKEDCDGGCID